MAMVSSNNLTGALHFIVERAAADIGTSRGAGLSLLTGGGRRITSAATDPMAERLNALHDRCFENPCVAAWAGRTTVRVDAQHDDPSWTAWLVAARDVGATSVLVAPLSTTKRLLGTLMVFSPEPDAYTDSDERMLAGYANDAAILIDEIQSACDQMSRSWGEHRKEHGVALDLVPLEAHIDG
jgi:GAF domain-containing protein